MLFSLLRTSPTRIHAASHFRTLSSAYDFRLIMIKDTYWLIDWKFHQIFQHHSKCSVFLLQCRYDLASNRWSLESRIPRKPPCNSSLAFIVLDWELYVITFWKSAERLDKRAGRLFIQIYHPQQKTWRSIITKSPFRYHLDFNAAVMSTVHLWISMYLCECEG